MLHNFKLPPSIVKGFAYCRKNWQPLIFSLLFSLAWSRFMFNGSFGDEQENMVAGWLINEGWVPYRDFFFHHMPLPFFISGAIYALRSLLGFSAYDGYQLYRLFILLFHLAIFFVTHQLLAKKIKKVLYVVYLLLLISSPFLTTFEFLADSLVASSLLSLPLLLYSAYHYSQPRFFSFLKVYIGLSLVIVYSSVVYTLALVLIFLLAILVYWPTIKQTIISRSKARLQLLHLLFIGLALALIFPLYFLSKQSFNSFYWSNVTYNRQHYFVQRLAEDQLELNHGFLFRAGRQFVKNLSKHTMKIQQATSTFFLTIASQAKLILLGQKQAPVALIFQVAWGDLWSRIGQAETAIMLAFIVSSCYWLCSHWPQGVVYLGLALTYRIRSNEIFHQAPFYLLVFAAVALMFTSLFNAMAQPQTSSRSIFSKLQPLALIVSVLLVIQLSFSFIPSFRGFVQHREGIVGNNLKLLSTQIKKTTTRQDRILFVSGSTAPYLFAQRYPATKFFYYLPWFQSASRMRNGISEAISNRSATLVLYKKQGLEFDPQLKELIDTYYQPAETDFVSYEGYVPRH
jgi:hypothetical protein